MREVVMAALALIACDVQRGAHDAAPHAPAEHDAPGTPTPPPPQPLAVEVALPPIAPPPEPEVRLDALCEPLAASTCRMHLGCRSGVTREALVACEAHIAAACEHERPRLEARIAAGRLRYDAMALRECQTRLEMLACAPPAEMQAALGAGCDGVLVGLLPDGASCDDAGDCAPGLACVASGACPGRCEPLRTLGDPCDAELAPCASGLLCEAGRCAPLAVGPGEPCVASAQCPTGTFCEDGLAGPECSPRRARGAGCDDDEQCAQADFCKLLSLDDELVLDVGTCAERLEAGSVCEPLVGGCAAGLACDEASATCMRVPDSAGQGCVADVAPCGAGTGLVCDAGQCELEPLTGDACDPDAFGAAACRFGFCARFDASGAGECRDFKRPGEACASDHECGALVCVSAGSGARCDRPAERCRASLHPIDVGFRYRIRGGAR